MNEETKLQNQIKIALSKAGCIVFRSNVGVFYTPDGRMVHIGVDGHSDLYGHSQDGKAFYIEVKTPLGKASEKQLNFIKQMRKTGANAGIARSVADALQIVGGEYGE